MVGSEILIESNWIRIDSVHSIERYELSKQRVLSVKNTSLEDITRTIPGVLSFDRNNLSVGDRISIRGSGWQSAFGIRGIRLFYEGMPLTGIDGQTMTELVDPQRVQAISISKGASASLFGNSSGGAIFTESSFKARQNVGFKMGSFGLIGTEIDYGFSDTNKTFFHVSHSLTKQSGFRDHSGAVLTRLGIRIKTQRSKEWWFTQGYYVVHSPELLNPGSLTVSEFYENPRRANPSNIRQNAGKALTHVAATYSFESEKKGQFSLFTQYRSLDNPLAFSWIQLNRMYSGISYDNKWNVNKFGKISVLADAAFQVDRRLNLQNRGGVKGNETLDQREFLSTLGIGLKHEMRINSRMRFENALRVDGTQFQLDDLFLKDADQSGNRSFINPGYSGSLWLDSKFITSFIAFKTAYDLPTTTELTNRPDGKSGFNANLKPESQIQYEFGIQNSPVFEKTTWSLNLYQNKIENIKIGEESSFQEGRTVYKNAGNGSLTGLEWFLKQDVFRSQTVQLSGTFLQSSLTNSGINETKIPGLPSYYITGNYEFRHDKFAGLIEFQKVGKQFADSENTIEIESWQSFSVQLSYTRKRFTYFVRLANIFDEMYAASVSVNSVSGRYYEPASGRNWLMGFRLF